MGEGIYVFIYIREAPKIRGSVQTIGRCCHDPKEFRL